MIEAVILLVMEVEKLIDGKPCRILELIIQSKYGLIKATVYNKAIDFMCEQVKASHSGELAGKPVVIDLDADYSCIYIIIKKKNKPKKLKPVSCEISLIKNHPKF